MSFPRPGWTVLTCLVCERTFPIHNSEVRKGRKYCSRSCWRKRPIKRNPRPRTITANGYVSVYAPDHPTADRQGRVLEHRLVWERAHGLLPEDWDVHHKDGDKTNNALENLEAMPKSEHTSLHVADRRYTRQELIDNLREVAAKNGGRISHKAFKRLSPITHTPYFRVWGTWKKAVFEILGKEAYYKKSPAKPKYTRNQLVKHLRDLTRTLGRAPTIDEMNNSGFCSYQPYAREWGSWSEAKRVILGEDSVYKAGRKRVS